MSESLPTNYVDVALIATHINTKELSKRISEGRLFRDVLLIPKHSTMRFVFSMGVVITWYAEVPGSWGFSEIESDSVIHSNPLQESYPFRLDNQDVSVRHDEIRLSDYEPQTLLAISYALAQSINLASFETLAEKTIQENAYLPQKLAETGKIPLPRKHLAKLRGRLFKTKNDILLRYNLLDTPEFFWENPKHESVYLEVAKYLELVSRVKLLTLKLETISELLEVLASEQNHKHSAFLEWIIIILIAVDIAVYFGH